MLKSGRSYGQWQYTDNSHRNDICDCTKNCAPLSEYEAGPHYRSCVTLLLNTLVKQTYVRVTHTTIVWTSLSRDPKLPLLPTERDAFSASVFVLASDCLFNGRSQACKCPRPISWHPQDHTAQKSCPSKANCWKQLSAMA